MGTARTITRRRLMQASAAAMAPLVLPRLGRAQGSASSWPSKPVRMIVPFPPGPDQCRHPPGDRRAGDQGADRNLGIGVAPSSPEEMAARIQSDIKVWEPIIKAAGFYKSQ